MRNGPLDAFQTGRKLAKFSKGAEEDTDLLSATAMITFGHFFSGVDLRDLNNSSIGNPIVDGFDKASETLRTVVFARFNRRRIGLRWKPDAIRYTVRTTVLGMLNHSPGRA